MSRQTFSSLKRTEARERMASVRRASRSRRAALTEQRKAAFVKDAAGWRITGLARVLRAMA